MRTANRLYQTAGALIIPLLFAAPAPAAQCSAKPNLVGSSSGHGEQYTNVCLNFLGVFLALVQAGEQEENAPPEKEEGRTWREDRSGPTEELDPRLEARIEGSALVVSAKKQSRCSIETVEFSETNLVRPHTINWVLVGSGVVAAGLSALIGAAMIAAAPIFTLTVAIGVAVLGVGGLLAAGAFGGGTGLYAWLNKSQIVDTQTRERVVETKPADCPGPPEAAAGVHLTFDVWDEEAVDLVTDADGNVRHELDLEQIRLPSLGNSWSTVSLAGSDTAWPVDGMPSASSFRASLLEAEESDDLDAQITLFSSWFAGESTQDLRDRRTQLVEDERRREEEAAARRAEEERLRREEEERHRVAEQERLAKELAELQAAHSRWREALRAEERRGLRSTDVGEVLKRADGLPFVPQKLPPDVDPASADEERVKTRIKLLSRAAKLTLGRKKKLMGVAASLEADFVRRLARKMESVPQESHTTKFDNQITQLEELRRELNIDSMTIARGEGWRLDSNGLLHVSAKTKATAARAFRDGLRAYLKGETAELVAQLGAGCAKRCKWTVETTGTRVAPDGSMLRVSIKVELYDAFGDYQGGHSGWNGAKFDFERVGGRWTGDVNCLSVFLTMD